MKSENRQDIISESFAFRDILPLIHHDSWIFLDLDNTVIESRSEVGGDQWFTCMIQMACETLLDSDTACRYVIDIYHSIQHIVRAQAVEAEAVFLIRALQDIGLPVVALTARDYCLLAPTVRQLNEAGIRFFESYYYFMGDNFDPECPVSLTQDNKTILDHGIIFCAGQNKGKCLQAFFEFLGRQPAHLVMVDDKLRHLETVQTLALQLQIPFNGLRYGYLDEKVASIDMQRAHLSLTRLRPHLSGPANHAIDQLKLNTDHQASPERPLAPEPDDLFYINSADQPSPRSLISFFPPTPPPSPKNNPLKTGEIRLKK